MSAQADSQSTLTIMGDSTSGGPTTPEGAEAASTYCSLPTPPSSAAVRKRLRDKTQQPKARQKRAKKTKEQLDISELVDPPLRIIDRKTRWMVLLTASNSQHVAIIREAYGKDIDPDSYEWKSARTKIFDNVKAHKHRVLERVISHVRAIKTIERSRGSLFPDLKDVKHLHKEFMRMFKKESLFEVFSYMDGYLDVETSSELGQYYLQNLYANLCVRAKRFVDYQEAHPDETYLDERKKLSSFYNRMTNKKEFDEVDKSCFAKTFEKSLREKIKRKFTPNMLADDNPDFVLSAPPPPKRNTSSAAIF